MSVKLTKLLTDVSEMIYFNALTTFDGDQVMTVKWLSLLPLKHCMLIKVLTDNRKDVCIIAL